MCRSAEKQSAIAPISLPNARQSTSRRLSGSTQTSSAVEMYQLADELSYITGVAGVCFAITLVVSSSPITLPSMLRCILRGVKE